MSKEITSMALPVTENESDIDSEVNGATVEGDTATVGRKRLKQSRGAIECLGDLVSEALQPNAQSYIHKADCDLARRREKN